MKKKKYIKPTISVVSIKMEEGICAGSAVVRPQNGSNEIIEEWEVTTEPTRNIDW